MSADANSNVAAPVAAASAATADSAAAPASSSAAASSSSPIGSQAEGFVDMSDLGCFESAGDDLIPLEDRVPPRRLLRAEAILARRTSRLLLVIETISDENNHQALLRTADSFGLQHVWVVRSGVDRKNAAAAAAAAAAAQPAYSASKLAEKVRTRPSVRQAAIAQVVDDEQQVVDSTGTISMGAGRWLTLRYFDSTTACIRALREDNRSIWVTTLRPGARVLDRSFPASAVPASVALVVGREIDGVSPEMCAAASTAVFLPMQGFSESFNVSVAGALAIQRLMDLIPESVGDLRAAEKAQLRKTWYAHLASNTPALVDEYANFWLPRAEEVEAYMKQMQAQEAQAAAAASGEAVTSASLSVSALLRPLEELRVPKVQRRVRLRMEAEGQRAVILQPDSTPTSDNPVSVVQARADVALSAASSGSNSAAAASPTAAKQ